VRALQAETDLLALRTCLLEVEKGNLQENLHNLDESMSFLTSAHASAQNQNAILQSQLTTTTMQLASLQSAHSSSQASQQSRQLAELAQVRSGFDALLREREVYYCAELAQKQEIIDDLRNFTALTQKSEEVLALEMRVHQLREADDSKHQIAGRTAGSDSGIDQRPDWRSPDRVPDRHNQGDDDDDSHLDVENKDDGDGSSGYRQDEPASPKMRTAEASFGTHSGKSSQKRQIGLHQQQLNPSTSRTPASSSTKILDDSKIKKKEPPQSSIAIDVNRSHGTDAEMESILMSTPDSYPCPNSAIGSVSNLPPAPSSACSTAPTASMDSGFNERKLQINQILQQRPVADKYHENYFPLSSNDDDDFLYTSTDSGSIPDENDANSVISCKGGTPTKGNSAHEELTKVFGNISID
jgi:hypothetical protein